MSGTFYGVGVGPGDPELLTIKALNIIKACPVLAVPISDQRLSEPVLERAGQPGVCSELLQKCVAYQIVLAALPEVEQKDKLYLPMPMIKDRERLRQTHDQCAAEAAVSLENNHDIAFITLGDPTVYSTCLYIHKWIKKMGFVTGLIPGVPSFCAAAARMDIGLVENKDQLHIIPGSYEIEQGLKMDGTRILMKAGRNMPVVKQAIKEQGLAVHMVENCGMADEQIYRTVDEIPDDAGYYSLLIVKEEDR